MCDKIWEERQKKFFIDNSEFQIYYISMRKRKLGLIIICAALVCVLTLSLTGCLKIGMRERNLQQRLEKAGAEISHQRTAPMFADWSAKQINNIGTILYAYMTVSQYNAELGENTEHQDMLYVVFARSDEGAEMAEDAMNKWLDDEKALRAAGEEDPSGDIEPEWDIEKWRVYRYDRVLMCGHWQILSVARMY